MTHRLVKLFGVELSVALDDSFRSSRLWLWFLKPLSYRVVSAFAMIAGAFESWRTPVAGTPKTDAPSEPNPELENIRQELKQVRWYHTIPLRDGLTTPGAYDHRPYVPKFPIPDSLEGMRVLDAGTLDGFWAFEMERRGAREVVALDVAKIGELDLPPKARVATPPEVLEQRTGAGFEIAHRLKSSRVQRVTMSLYELSPERLGHFDFVLCSDLLCLVSDPVAVLQNLNRVTRGTAAIMDRYNPYLPKYQMYYHGAEEGCLWWSYSLMALEKMIGDAGFSDVQIAARFQFAEQGKRAWSSAATFRARSV